MNAVKVIFRKFPDGEIIALFPEEPATRDPSFCSSYVHHGQHGAASTDLVRYTRPATETEFASLKHELESRGYILRPRRRFPVGSYELRKKAIQN